MAYTFLKAKGIDIGTSILDEESIDFARDMINQYADKIVLPKDVKVTKEFLNDSPCKIKSINNISTDEMGLDIGLETVNMFESILDTAKVVFWNGPLGVYEFSNFKWII